MRAHAARRCYLEQVKSWFVSGSSIVTMIQPADSLLRESTCASGWNSTVRSSLPDSEVRAVLMVVLEVFRK